MLSILYNKNVFGAIRNKHTAFTPTFSKGMFYETAHKEFMKDRESWNNVFKPFVAVNTDTVTLCLQLTGTSKNLKQLTGLKRNPHLENDRVQHSPSGRRKSQRQWGRGRHKHHEPIWSGWRHGTLHPTTTRAHSLQVTDPMLSHKVTSKISGKKSKYLEIKQQNSK